MPTAAHGRENLVGCRGMGDDRFLRTILPCIRRCLQTEPAAQLDPVLAGLLFQQHPDAVLLVDLSGRLLEVNDAACRLAGWSRAEMLAMRPWQMLLATSPLEVREWLRSRSRDAAETFILTLAHRLGHVIRVEARVRRVASLIGETASLSLVVSSRHRVAPPGLRRLCRPASSHIFSNSSCSCASTTSPSSRRRSACAWPWSWAGWGCGSGRPLQTPTRATGRTG
ncbi:PAS domain-containing protein [Verrucomicrobium spinosum]|uniref:PAS domain-containing protein n=1 Tax=Verrucomicrobium spinosum TaxID=2736 RepID=UPI0009468079|nr:PAS domain-containing protein [Verrucomicrobium spinosum]